MNAISFVCFQVTAIVYEKLEQYTKLKTQADLWETKDWS